MIYRLPYACATKQRPRVTRRGITYMPQAYVVWKKHTRAELYQQGATVLVGNLRMHVTARFRKCARGDADNYIGAVMDAANGVLYKDDKQCKDIRCIVLEQTGTDEVEVSLEVME